MSRIIELNDSPLRAVINDQGKITQIIDEHGNDMGIPTVAVNRVTGGVEIAAGGLYAIHNKNRPYQLKRLQAALARVRSGTGSALFAFVGDSTSAGVCANGTFSGSGVWTDCKKISTPTFVSQILQSSGVESAWDSVTSDNATLSHLGTIPQYDPRCVAGANWTQGSLPIPGGYPVYNTAASVGSTAAETFSFTSIKPFTDVDIYWYRSPSVGTFTADIGGGAVLSTMAPGAPGVVKTTVTGLSDATHTLNLTRTTTGQVIILGWVCKHATKPRVDILNMGGSGWKTSDWNSSVGLYSPIPALKTYAPDFTVINLGINDWLNSVSYDVTYANMMAIIAAAAVSGDVAVKLPTPSSLPVASLDKQQATIRALVTAAKDSGVPIIDLYSRFVDYTSANALGYCASDGIHDKKAGYADDADLTARFILA